MLPLRDLADFAPGNGLVLRKLISRLASGRVVGFLGAGTSAEIYPGWEALVELFLKHALDSGFATDAQFDRD